MNCICLSHSSAETEHIGELLAKEIIGRKSLLNDGNNIFIALYGDLGAGKTAFVRGMAGIIAPDALVASPTFAIMNEYSGKDFTLCHFDMYRIKDDDDLYSVGFYDLSGVIIAAEWCENIPFALPQSYYSVSITRDFTAGYSENEENENGFRDAVRKIEIKEISG